MHKYNSLEILESRIAPAVLFVTSSADSSSATAGDGTLRGEILASNAAHTTDTIMFAHGVTSITLTDGPLNITNAVHLAGPGASKLSISGGGTSGIFTIGGKGAGTRFRGMTLQDGNAAAGGAIDSTVTITVKNSVLSGNTATDGGAIAIGAGNETAALVTVPAPHASLTLLNTTITGNTATDSGGGIYMEGVTGSVSILSSKFEGNTAGTYGGAADLAGLRNFTLAHSLVSGEASPFSETTNASYAGGMEVRAHKIVISDSYIGDNRSSNAVGGLALRAEGNGSSVTITGSSISGNSSVGNGGDAYAPIGGMIIVGAAKSLPTIIAYTKIIGNDAAGFAGGLFLANGPSILLHDSISNNTADNTGGGVATTGGMTMVACAVEGNLINGTSGTDGGVPLSGGAGISIFGGNAAIISSHVINNSITAANGEGGGIIQAGGGSLLIVNSFVNDNKTTAQGGGIAIGVVPNNMTPGIVHPSIQQAPPTGPAPAAAFHFSMVGTRVSGNTAGGEGGAIYLTGSTNTNIQQSIFQGNSSTGGTGGVVIDTTGKAHLSDATFLGNVGTTNGGLYAEEISATSTLTVIGGRFAHNEGGRTGGFHINNGIKALVEDVAIHQNVSTGDIFGAGGFSVGSDNIPIAPAPASVDKPAPFDVTVLDSTITGNINVNFPAKANTYGDFKT